MKSKFAHLQVLEELAAGLRDKRRDAYLETRDFVVAVIEQGTDYERKLFAQFYKTSCDHRQLAGFLRLLINKLEKLN